MDLTGELKDIRLHMFNSAEVRVYVTKGEFRYRGMTVRFEFPGGRLWLAIRNIYGEPVCYLFCDIIVVVVGEGFKSRNSKKTQLNCKTN